MKFNKVTGQSTDVFDLLDQFKTFIDTNTSAEWTVNGYTDVNASLPRRGKHLSISNSRGLYFNFNSCDYRNPFSKTSTSEQLNNYTQPSQYSPMPYLICTLSKGYDSSLEYYKQPGYLSQLSNNGYIGGGIVHNHSVTNNHTFLISDDEKLIVLINEFNNRFFYMFFGDLNQNWIDTTEGQFLWASHMISKNYNEGLGIPNDDDYNNNYSSIYSNYVFTPVNAEIFDKLGMNTGTSYYRLAILTYKYNDVVDYEKPVYFSTYNSTSNSYELPKWPKEEFGNSFSYNKYNQNSILYPIDLYVDTSSQDTYRYPQNAEELRKAATVSGTYIVNMSHFDVNEIITIGLDKYLIIPLYKKNNPQNYENAWSKGFGFAFAIN